MKYLRPLVTASALLLTVLLVFSGCGAKVNYKDNVPSEQITREITQKVTVESGYTVCDPDFIQFYLTDAVQLVNDYSIVYATAADDYTEIGVLHVQNKKNLKDVETVVQNYLDEFRTTYEPQAQQYDPSEQQKLKDAAYRVYGNYVIYTIATAETQEIYDGIIMKLLEDVQTEA